MERWKEKSGPPLNLFFSLLFSSFAFFSADVIKCLCRLYWLSGQHTRTPSQHAPVGRGPISG